MQVGTTKDQGLYNKPSAAVHPVALAAGTLPQYNRLRVALKILILHSQRNKTNLLHNTAAYLQLDLQHVSARFIGCLQGVTCSSVRLHKEMLQIKTENVPERVQNFSEY